MKLQSIFIISALLVLFFSCNQNINSEKQSAMKEGKTELKKEAKTDLTKFGIKENPKYELGGLAEGTAAPLFDKTTNLKSNFNLAKELEKNPVVVLFYRGYWCPVCHKYLSQFQEDLVVAQKEKQFSVVAITPEQFEFVEKTVEKDALTIPVIYDEDESIMKNYKVAFEVTDKYDKKIKNFLRSDIAENNGKSDATLPVPATYVIGQDGKIIKTFYDPNYKNRASVSDIMNHL